MSTQQVLVRYILHVQQKIDNLVIPLSNQFFQTNNKIQILGKQSKNILLSQIRKKYNLDPEKIRFMNKSASSIQIKPSINNQRYINMQYPNAQVCKYQLLNIKGQQTIRLMQIFDYNYTISMLDQQSIKATTCLSPSQNFLIHLCNIGSEKNFEIVHKIVQNVQTQSKPNISPFINNILIPDKQMIKQIENENNKRGIKVLMTQKTIDKISNEKETEIDNKLKETHQTIQRLIDHVNGVPSTTNNNTVINPNSNTISNTNANSINNNNNANNSIKNINSKTNNTNSNNNTNVVSNTNTNKNPSTAVSSTSNNPNNSLNPTSNSQINVVSASSINSNSNSNNINNNNNNFPISGSNSISPPTVNPSSNTNISNNKFNDNSSLSPSPDLNNNKVADNLIKKVIKMTSKQQMLYTLKLAKATHRSYHSHQQIKQRTIIDFQNSKIELINAYKNFFYQKQIILKDENQSRYFKDSLNSLQFSLDVGAPSAALDTKIGMAMLKTTTKSQQNYLYSSSFSQLHIAYSFEQAFQIEPENIKLTKQLISAFKNIFLKYLVLYNNSKKLLNQINNKQNQNQNNFLLQRIRQIPEIKQNLENFYRQFGSQIQCGTFVFGGKYLAETNFKFLSNLDIKSKQKVRNVQGKFTLQGGSVNVGGKSKQTQKEQQTSRIATQNTLVTRNYILFPGSSKNLAQWNNSLQNSRQDWKLILKDVKRIFIGQVIASKINAQEFLLIQPNVFGIFLQKIKQYYNEFNKQNHLEQTTSLNVYKRKRMFILWKQEIIRKLKVLKLTLAQRIYVHQNNNRNIIETQNGQTQRPFRSQQLIKNKNFPNRNTTKDHQQFQKLNNPKQIKPFPFYILLRNKQIESAYPQILGNTTGYQQQRQIYDSKIQRCLFRYFLCCFLRPKKHINQLQQKRKKYAKYFYDAQNSQSINKSVFQIYNMQLQNSFNNQKKNHQSFRNISIMLSSSTSVKHIFDINQQQFAEGRIQNLLFKTVPKQDLFNRSYRYQILFSIQFLNKKKGLLNLIQLSQQEKVVVQVKSIRKVSLIGQVIQHKVKMYQNLFVNDPHVEHHMMIQKLSNIGG